jgi:hypothetical protein
MSIHSLSITPHGVKTILANGTPPDPARKPKARTEVVTISQPRLKGKINNNPMSFLTKPTLRLYLNK